MEAENKLKLQQKVEKIYDILIMRGVGLELTTSSLEIQNNFNEKYFSLNIKCPFLNEEEECICYDVRPITCWNYKHYGNPKDCKKEHRPKFNHVYSNCDCRLTPKMYEVRIPQHCSFYILPYAVYKIFRNMGSI